jgi:hypothetical protein
MSAAGYALGRGVELGVKDGAPSRGVKIGSVKIMSLVLTQTLRQRLPYNQEVKPVILISDKGW